MLVPAALYKQEIENNMKKYFYTEKMFFVVGCIDNWIPNIYECPDGSTYQYAIVNKNKELIGYFGYVVDWRSKKAYNFGLFSFDYQSNITIGYDVLHKLKYLISILHKIEWRAVGNNPVIKSYDNFVKKYNGNKHILKDSIMWTDGKYVDDIIYEIINQNN